MANSNDPFIARRNGFNQAAAADLARFAQDRPGGAVDSQDNQNSQGEYLRDVLNGASPVDIVDHGLGPFEDKAMHFQPSGFGVVSILNIPYNVTKSEIEHFLGRNASMIAHNQQGCSIHVIMERPTSKTMDCFVELLTPEAAQDAYNKHENLVMSGKHPRIGTRHVDVVTSDQDKLLKAIFPRTRGLIWEQGVPRKVQNNDPYSAGFQGFFTREEMIGMYRHAETPQRSPFSVKCLQRTFECMISTLYKFPWHAQHMYTLEDRAQLFDCYMRQLSVLVFKVAEAQTVGLDTKLLIDFVSAGLNCVGFGERMRYMIAAHSGQVSAGFPISKKSASWPFDVLSVPFIAPDGGRWWFEHADTLDLLMYIIELGHDVCGNNYAHSQWIQTLPQGPPSDFDHQTITSVRFKFREDVFNVSYDEIISRETELMRQMLQFGFAKWQSSMRQAWEKGEFNDDMQKDVDCLANLQHWDQIYGGCSQMVLSESPKGTAVKEEEEEGWMTIQAGAPPENQPDAHQSSTPVLSQIDPTVDAFEPYLRRNSEPPLTTPHETITTPVRADSVRDLKSFGPLKPSIRQSSALEIRHPDRPVVFAPKTGSSPKHLSIGTIGGHRGGSDRWPMKPKHARGAFSVHTIPEMNEDDGSEEEIMMTGRPRRSTNAAF